jgi:hypothetical protein
MVPNFSSRVNAADRYYISKVSIARLLDLRSEIGGETIYTYNEISQGTSEVLSHGITTQRHLLYFTGVILSNLKNEI